MSPASADDVVQNVASVLWRKFESFEQGTNFRAWAFAIARFEVLRFRDKNKETSLILSLDEKTLERLESPAVEYDNEYVEYRKGLLKQCLDRLGEDARMLVEMRYGNENSFDELAQLLKKSSGALRIQISRIRKTLRECVMSHVNVVQA